MARVISSPRRVVITEIKFLGFALRIILVVELITRAIQFFKRITSLLIYRIGFKDFQKSLKADYI